MNKNISLTKTCSSCGLEKPLSAFLQIAGPEGAMYGKICASCRSGKLDKAKVQKEPDESTKGSTGFKIDAKAKQKSDADKLQFRKEAEEKYREEREKLKSETLQKTNKTDKTLSLERKHREDFLHRTYGEKKAEKGAASQQTAGKEAANLDASLKEEAKVKGFDPTNFGRLGSEIRMQGASFRAWLAANPNAAIARTFGLDKQAQKDAKATQEKIPPEKKVTNEDVKEFIKENLPTTPGSRRGR